MEVNSFGDSSNIRAERAQWRKGGDRINHCNKRVRKVDVGS